MHRFRAAIEARDIPAAVELLHEDVLFRSPVAFAPYRGRAAVAPILWAVSEVFAEFRYVREIGEHGAADLALLFEARIGTSYIEGCDFLHLGANGVVEELTVMVRPLTAAQELAEAMKLQLTTFPAKRRTPHGPPPSPLQSR